MVDQEAEGLAVIKDDPEALAMFREAMKHQGERKDLRDFPNNVSEVEGVTHGNSRAYSIDRVSERIRPPLPRKY